MGLRYPEYHVSARTRFHFVPGLSPPGQMAPSSAHPYMSSDSSTEVFSGADRCLAHASVVSAAQDPWEEAVIGSA